MRATVITIAGISSRFNEGVPEEEKKHKAIYYEKDRRDTLLCHLIEKSVSSDRIIIVGGYKYKDVELYCNELPKEFKDRIILVYNKHYEDLGSGYSLYLGLQELFHRFRELGEVIFIEGDLDVDNESFDSIIRSDSNVITYSFEPIYANKAVVLYKDHEGRYKYAFNSDHGLLSINSPFSCIFNSGQIWKFTDIDKLKASCDKYYSENRNNTNLAIIQNYIDISDRDHFDLIGLKRWTNCNTRADYRKILCYWEEER